jgi:hypothetical protein
MRMSRRVGGSKTGRENLNYGYQVGGQDKFQSRCEFRSKPGVIKARYRVWSELDIQISGSSFSLNWILA